MTKEKLIVITGPTAVGKTALSISIAQEFNGEIINGDSMQIYKGLDIGTAKASPQEQSQARHHLIDIREIWQGYSAADFKTDARQATKQLSAQGKLPIVVGGTGLYLESFLYDLSLGQSVSPQPEFRQAMYDLADQEGNLAVYQRLQTLDPQAAARVHPNNLKRVIRMLEVGTFSDQLFSQQEETHNNHHSPYDLYVIALTTERQLLYQRINHRVDLMIEEGLIDEARMIYEASLDKEAQSMKAIGYKEFFPYFAGTISLEQASQQLKQNSRRYAKRQETWIRNRMTNVHSFNLIEDPESQAVLMAEIADFLRDKKE